VFGLAVPDLLLGSTLVEVKATSSPRSNVSGPAKSSTQLLLDVDDVYGLRFVVV